MHSLIYQSTSCTNSIQFFVGESFMLRYIPLYLEAVLPNFPKEGIHAIKDHLTTENILSQISFHLGTRDMILSDVNVTAYQI